MVFLKERRIKHYSSHHNILLVGEGNFSFATSLANAFGSASNITATSLDNRDTVISVYADQGEANLLYLKEHGAVVIHGVDAHTMYKHRRLKHKLFDRIVFNFPHSGGDRYLQESSTSYIEGHQRVVKGFFDAAKYMLAKGGEIHVTHKTSRPFSRWNIVGLAEDSGLVLKKEVEFNRWDYPGYINKRAYGDRWNRTFRVGECSTFMFSTSS